MTLNPNYAANWASLAWSVQFASCLYMAGVISVIQLIHYPTFPRVAKPEFAAFHRAHSNALTWIAAPAMGAELISAVWLARHANCWLLANLVSVALLWFITFGLSVPQHNRLAGGFDERAWSRLMFSNRLRTFIWMGRALALTIALTFMLDRYFLPGFP